PAMADDVRTALIFLNQHADALSVDQNRIGLGGYSAGAHLSSLISVMMNEPISTRVLSSHWGADDPRWGKLPKIAGACVGGPPCDFRNLPPANVSMAYFLGGSREEVPDQYFAASVTAHVSPGDPPIRIIHGDKDFIVPIANSEGLVEACRSHDVPAELIRIPGEGHLVTFMHDRTRSAVAEFFRDLFFTGDTHSGDGNSSLANAGGQLSEDDVRVVPAKTGVGHADAANQ
ncbi:MAG: alpha/beta hydrolase, partial [Planctomycetota bacterium]